MEPSENTEALVLGSAARAARLVPGAPRVTAASAEPLREIAAIDEQGAARRLQLPVERPLSILLDGREIVTLMTLGAAPEWLVLGYLCNNRIIDRAAMLRSIEVDWTRSVAVVISHRGEGPGRAGGGGQGASPSPSIGCGLGTAFGDVMRRFDSGERLGIGAGAGAGAGAGESESEREGEGAGAGESESEREGESAGVREGGGVAAGARGMGAGEAKAGEGMAGEGMGPAERVRLGRTPECAAASMATTSHSTILAILDSMRRHDAIHRAAGSVHSCALFQGEELWVAVEDVSRHNGVDTLTGFMRLYGVVGSDKILFTTGRLTGEMVMKAAHNGIPVMISRNGTTAMGFVLAAKLGMTLIGRAANRRYLCYVGADRIVRDAVPVEAASAGGEAKPGGEAKFPLD